MMSNEDKRAAVSFSITLSSSIIAATVAVLAIEGSFVAYAFGGRSPLVGFALLAAASAISLVASVIFAGKGITKTRNSGFAGDWSLEVGRPLFNKQAGFCLVGLLLFGLTLALSGPSKQSTLERDLEQARTALEQARSKIDELNSSIEMLTTGHGDQEAKIGAIESEVESLRTGLQRSTPSPDIKPQGPPHQP